MSAREARAAAAARFLAARGGDAPAGSPAPRPPPAAAEDATAFLDREIAELFGGFADASVTLFSDDWMDDGLRGSLKEEARADGTRQARAVPEVLRQAARRYLSASGGRTAEGKPAGGGSPAAARGFRNRKVSG